MQPCIDIDCEVSEVVFYRTNIGWTILRAILHSDSPTTVVGGLEARLNKAHKEALSSRPRIYYVVLFTACVLDMG
jgi:hypothetical protein